MAHKQIIQFGDKLSHMLCTKTQSYGSFSRKFQPNIEALQATAHYNKARALASNQIGLDQSLLVLLPNSAIKPLPSEYKVCFNPKILRISSETVTNYEESLSFPIFKAEVTRYKSIYVGYDTKQGKEIEEELDGIDALAFQQALDSLMGVHLLSWIVSFGQIQIKKQFRATAEASSSFMETLNEYQNQAEIQFPDKPLRQIAQLNLSENSQNYAVEGPTHPIKYQLLEDELLKQIELELFYTFQ